MPGWFRGRFWRMLFSGFRWYRRRYGGVWEQWHVNAPGATRVWCTMDAPTGSGPRPPFCCGTPVVEDYRSAQQEKKRT